MTEALRQMVPIPSHPTTLASMPRHAGDTTAELAATATEELRNLGNGLHPAPLQRTRPGEWLWPLYISISRTDPFSAQRFDEALAIRIIHEDQFAPVTAIHDVINRASLLDSQLAV